MSRHNQVALFKSDRLSKSDYKEFCACNDRATRYKRQGRLIQALNELRKAILLQPNDVYTLNNRADILNKMTQFEAALEDFNRVLLIDPSNAFALKGRKIALENRKKYPAQSVKSTSTVRFLGGESRVRATKSANGRYLITSQSLSLR